MAVIFCDVDGTLVHYGEQPRADLLQLPASSSGLCGSISVETLALVASLRASGHRFALVSGMRCSTFFARLPFLPACDAYVIESGGRVFLAEPLRGTAAAFSEDLGWRRSHRAAGDVQEAVAPEARAGELWDAYRSFTAQGLRCDASSYSTQFRLRPPVGASGSEGEAAVRRALAALPASLTHCENLGCCDVLPRTSGKTHAAAHLCALWGARLDEAVFLCDDDNDVELAQAVSHAFVVGLTAASLAQAVQAAPQRFTLAQAKGTAASEEALQLVARHLAARGGID